jgi:hypothetical protein
MKQFEFACVDHPEKVVTLEADSFKSVPEAGRMCVDCGRLMERYHGGNAPSIAYKGPNWPKRDIRERAHRLRRADTLSKRQKDVWDPRAPKLNLDPEVQREARRQVIGTGTPLKATKV